MAPAAPSSGSAPAASRLEAPEGKTGVQLSAPEGSRGTEVRIPGLGKLGVLPKLDFGLDILYGAAEDRRIAPGSQGATDEVTIKGRIQHKF